MDDNTLFQIPSAGFMQTGNQQIPIEPPISIVQKDQTDNNFESDSSESISTATQETDSQEFQLPDFNIGEPSNIVGDKNQNKYAIFDMFWLINPKFYKKTQPAQNEAHIVVISFNITFGNLRVSYFDLTNNGIQNNIVYLENLKRTVSGTIYPATAFNVFTTPRLSTICIEQLFRQIPGAAWQAERPVCKVEKNESKIRFTIADPKFGTYFYDFEGWQYNAFLKSLEFTFTEGFTLTASKHIK